VFTVDAIYDEGKKIIGACDDTKFFRWCSDVTTIVCNKADLEAQKGVIDICTVGCRCHDRGLTNHERGCGSACVTMPREVGTVLAVNVEGRPSLGVDQLFSFHLNGPGDRPLHTRCEHQWQDQGANHSTYRDLLTPALLVAYLQRPEDAGKALIVYGYDSAGQLLRREEGGVWLNGYRVPTIYGVAMPDAGAPLIARITGVFKDSTVGSVRLATIDSSGSTGVNLAVYEPDENVPQYRRITLNRCARWVRVAYMRANPIYTSRFDHIPMLSRAAFLIGMQARKDYSDRQWADAHSAEADAARLEIEAQQKIEPPVYMPVQVIDRNNPRDKSDYDIR
jgi:hypothetical protein